MVLADAVSAACFKTLEIRRERWEIYYQLFMMISGITKNFAGERARSRRMASTVATGKPLANISGCAGTSRSQ